MVMRPKMQRNSITNELLPETLFEVLCYLHSIDLGRTSCVSKLMLLISDEVQNHPYFDTAHGDIKTIIPSLLASSLVCPSIAFVFRGNDFDRSKSIHEYTGCLPPKCAVLGCDDVPLFIPPVKDATISQASVSLVHFPDAHVQSFCFDNDMCDDIMSSDDVGLAFATKAGLTSDIQDTEPQREWKMIILLVASDDGIENLVVSLQVIYPNTVIIGALCERVYSRPRAVGPDSQSSMFEGEGIAGVAISGDAPFKPLIAYPYWTPVTRKLKKIDMKQSLQSKLENLSKELKQNKQEVLGSLLFTCSGRIPEQKLSSGEYLRHQMGNVEMTLGEYETELDDVKAFEEVFPNAPISGFYSNGEIGPAEEKHMNGVVP